MSMLQQPSEPEPATRVAGLRLLVSLPALNEALTVADVIRRIPTRIEGVGSISVLAVDDGSSDETSEEALRAGAQVIRHDRTRGVGAAFCTALGHAVATGVDLFVTIDADGQFDPGDIPAIVKPVVDGEADFTTASRFKDARLTPSDMTPVKLWGNRTIARIISRLAGERIHDVSCGMRCYGRRATLELNPMASFTYTQEILLNLAFKHLRIREVPVRVQGTRTHGESRVASNVLAYALRSTAIIVRCYRDYKPMALFGTAALVLASVGIMLGTFLGVHWLATGAFSPHKWAGFTGAALIATALQLLLIGMVGDMLNRHRVYLEELLYESRARTGRAASDEGPPVSVAPRTGDPA